MASLREWKSKSIAYLLSEIELYIGFWALKVQCTHYGFMDKATILEECKGNFLLF